MKIKGEFYLEKYSNSFKELEFVHSPYVTAVSTEKIIFQAVYFMEIPNYIVDPEIIEGNEEDRKLIEEKLKNTYQIMWGIEKLFIIKTLGRKFYIGSGNCKIREINNR